MFIDFPVIVVEWVALGSLTFFRKKAGFMTFFAFYARNGDKKRVYISILPQRLKNYMATEK